LESFRDIDIKMEFNIIINRISVTSSHIRSIGYDLESKTLEIEFKSGDSFLYYTIDEELHLDLMNAESKGKFYNRYIRGQFPSEKKY